jgi:hypothetical protein
MNVLPPNKIFSRQFIYQECLNPAAILGQTDTFEEYPLIYRIQQIDNWKKSFPGIDILPLWINSAVFILNYFSKCVEKEHLPFLCITFTDFDDEYPPIPKIFTSTTKCEIQIINDINSNSNSKEMATIKMGFEAAAYFYEFNFYESRFFDKAANSEIVRIYCIYR